MLEGAEHDPRGVVGEEVAGRRDLGDKADREWQLANQPRALALEPRRIDVRGTPVSKPYDRTRLLATPAPM